MKPENQDTPPGVSVFRRSRRAAAALAFSIGVGSLAYGTILSLPAAAQTGTADTPVCTASAAPTDTATGTGAGAAAHDADGDGSASASASDGASQGSDDGASASASASASDTPTATATSTGTDEACTTAPADTPSSSTASPSISLSRPVSTPSRTLVPVSGSPTPSKSQSAIAGKGSPTAQPPTTQNTVPVYVVAPTGTYSYFAYAAAPPGDASYQLPHGTISRAQIMARAALWVQEQVPYSQTKWFTNQNGTYRQDCSGFVSMAWDLDQYTDFWTGNLNLVSHTISAAQLLPGDILLSNEHTILFAGWANAEHTTFDYYEEAHPGTVARYVVDAPLAAFLDNGFAPFRYDGVVDSATLPANPVSGDPYALLAQQGSEMNPSGVATGPLPGLSSSTPKKIKAQAVADVSAAGGTNGGMALGVGGAFLLGAGVLMRQPVLQERRRRH